MVETNNMKLSFMLQRDCVAAHLPFTPRTKEALLSSLVDILTANTPLAEEKYTQTEIVDSLMARENDLSTAVGEGFAFPHARLDNLKGAYMLFATSENGFEFDSPDGGKVHFVFMTIVSRDRANLLLQARASLMRCLLTPEARRLALECRDSDSLWKFIDRSGANINSEIFLHDIMYPQNTFLTESMSVAEASAVFHSSHASRLPLLDAEGRVTDVLSCSDLFELSMPAMFFGMKTLSFMKHSDPFELSLAGASSRLLSEMPRRDLATLPLLNGKATLTETVFKICSGRFDVVFVIDDSGRLAGSLKSYAIVDKILASTDKGDA